MDRSKKRLWFFDGLWFLACAIASSCWCWTAAREIGATFDEPIYVRRGVECWQTGSHRGLLKLGTMPLPVDIQTLPVYAWQRWQGVPAGTPVDLQRLLPWARAGNLVFWWILLAYGCLAGRRLAGPWGGRFAVALLACEPSLLAHASLATTDIAVTACLLALVYHFRTGRDAPWPQRVGLPMLWFAATLLAKASGLLFGPLCLCALEIERCWTTGGCQGRSRRQAAGCAWDTLRAPAFQRDLRHILLGGLMIMIVYCGCDWQPEPSLVAWAQGLSEGHTRQAMLWVAEHLRLFSNGLEGLVRQVKHNVGGQGSFLLGHEGEPVFWYFPVALSIKLSLPLLVLPLLVAWLRPRSLANWALLCATLLLAMSVFYRVQIGIRFALPLVALGIVGLAAAVVQTAAAASIGAEPEETRRGLGRFAAAGRRWTAPALIACSAFSLLWTTAAAVRIWPHGLTYANELYGGSRDSYRLLSDSNYDWGQGVKELARWQAEHGGAPLTVWYFGTDPAIHRQSFRLAAFGAPREGPEVVREAARGGYLAVGVTHLYGTYENCPKTLAFLRGLQPVSRTTTFLIYDFTGRSQMPPLADASDRPTLR
jgi:hypothetical protein